MDRFSWKEGVSFFLNSRESGEKKIVAIQRAPAITARRCPEHALLFPQIELQRMLHDGGKRLADLRGGLLRLGEQLRIKIQCGLHTLRIAKCLVSATASFVP